MEWKRILFNAVLLLVISYAEPSKKNKFVNKGEHITLQCEKTKIMVWQVPPDFTTYVSGKEIKNDLPQSDRLTLIDKQGQFNLHIESFKKEDEGLYKCQQFQNRTRDVIYDVRLKPVPDVAILPDKYVRAKEYSKVNLHCDYFSNYPVTNILWIQKNAEQKIILRNKTELIFKLISRIHAGTYECIVQNYKDNGTGSVTVVVEYAPDVSINHTCTDTERVFGCIPKGVPSNYTFFDWEHKTEDGDRIRLLPDTGNGTLILTKDKTKSNWFFDRGYYYCSVSNGIQVNGITKVTSRFFLNETGAPYFVSTNKKNQFATLKSEARLVAYFISFSKVNITITSRTTEREQGYDYYVNDSVKILEIIHKKIHPVNASRITVLFQPKTLQDFQPYTIVLSNSEGKTNFTINLQQEVPFKEDAIPTQVYLIIIFALVLLVSTPALGYKMFCKGTSVQFDVMRNSCCKRDSVEVNDIGGAVENEAYEMQNNLAQAALPEQHDVPVYSSIERRDNVSLGQQDYTVKCTSSRTKKPDPCTYRRMITGEEEDEQVASTSKEESQLNYIDVCFDSSPGEQRFKIRGSGNKNPYAEIDFPRTRNLQNSKSKHNDDDNDDHDEDFVDAEDVSKMKRRTHCQ